MHSISNNRSAGIDVAGTGFTVLDRVYADGEAPFEALGGSCGNVLLSLAMLRRQVTPILALGMDEIGEKLIYEFSCGGANTRFISRRRDSRSPVLAQTVDTLSGQHTFAFVCPETSKALPQYEPINGDEVVAALPVLTTCSVFYTDRLSEAILQAMKTAWDAGAIVYFEPSDVEEVDLFDRALPMTAILKYSADRLGGRLATWCGVEQAIRIVTYGAEGLELSRGPDRFWCKAVNAPVVADTCGSGDMVSVGVIDWILSRRMSRSDLDARHLAHGVIAGQRLAAANCAFTGARGIFRHKGAHYARRILESSAAEV